MKKLMMMIAVGAAILVTGCSVTKVEYEQGDNGKTSYRLYRNSHWLKMEGEGMKGGMTKDGKFEFDLEGLKSSPSEEFNRTMQTYTTAFVQLAQIAAAAYNPSASAAVQNATAKQGTASTAAQQTEALTAPKAAEIAPATTNAAACADGNCAAGNCTDCPTGTCTDGSCTVTVTGK